MDQEVLTRPIGKRPFSVITAVSRGMAGIASVTLGIMMVWVTADVAGREFFKFPVKGTDEIVGLLLIVASTWGMGFCQIEKKHLRIPLFYDMFPQAVRFGLDILAYVVCLGAAGLVTWQVIALALKYLSMSIGNVSTVLGLPFFPFMAALAWGFGWMCVILLVDIQDVFREAFKR